MNINTFWTLKFWFSVERANLHTRDYLIGILGIVLVSLSLFLWFYASKNVKPSLIKYWNSFRNTCAWVGGYLIFWLGFRFQYVDLFGTYFAALIVILAGVGVAVFRFKQMTTKGHENVRDLSALEEKLKYLPKNEADNLREQFLKKM
jgi:hypothetical protein